jgi:hypothetical protein
MSENILVVITRDLDTIGLQWTGARSAVKIDDAQDRPPAGRNDQGMALGLRSPGWQNAGDPSVVALVLTSSYRLAGKAV